MKTILFFLLAVVALQLPTEGESQLSSTRNQSEVPSLPKTLLFGTNLFLNSGWGTKVRTSKSDKCRWFVGEIFGSRHWRAVMVALATEQQLQDEDFKAKVGFTEDEIQEILASKRTLSPEETDKRDNYIASKSWRGLMALQASKNELLNEAYRERWGLGALSDSVKNSQEDGSFFQTPQFREFQRQKNIDASSTTENCKFVVGSIFADWLFQVSERLTTLVFTTEIIAIIAPLWKQ